MEKLESKTLTVLPTEIKRHRSLLVLHLHTVNITAIHFSTYGIMYIYKLELNLKILHGTFTYLLFLLFSGAFIFFFSF